MKLVEGWKQSWKWNSMQVYAFMAALSGGWGMLPPDLKAKIPPEWYPYIIAIVAIGGAVGRLRAQ